MHDVIVVGARCAGAATAMLLARAGARVLLLDRATLPSDIPHGHFIHRHGPRRLRDWGLLDAVLATGCPPVTEMTMGLGDPVVTGTELAVDGVPAGLGPRRDRLDAVLAGAAVAAGAELRDGFAVDELMRDGERVTGVRGRGARGGRRATERAAVVVGADGRNSGVAKAVGATAVESAPTLACWYFSYWSGVPQRGLEMYVRSERAIFAFPTNDELLAVFVAWPIAELPGVRADLERRFAAVLALAPELAERIRGGRREERFYGATQLPNFVRRVHGPGWALVGDAGCHKDPLMALGICDGLRDAELLAGALADGLAGRTGLGNALAGYERRRTEATLPEYRENLEAARLQPPPDQVARLLAALPDRPEDARHFYLAREGMVPPESFFGEDNLRRIVMAGAAARAD